MKALSAFLSIWFIFFGLLNLSSKPLTAFILLGFGGLLLAVAYGAIQKPAYFLLSVATVLTALLFRGLDSIGMFPLLGVLIGIAASSRFIKHYYGSKESNTENKHEIKDA